MTPVVRHRLVGWVTLFAALFLTQSCQAAKFDDAPAQVMVVASIHGLHKNHPAYDYDDLYAAVRASEPDFVGVEMRPEDMSEVEDYLSRNYPREMIALKKEFGSRAFGFDWLGEDVAGAPGSQWRQPQQPRPAPPSPHHRLKAPQPPPARAVSYPSSELLMRRFMK